MEQVLWKLDNLSQVNGLPMQVIGSPRLIEGLTGPAIEFGGNGDGIIVDADPLAGWETFTLEALFRPDANGPAEQRFVHVQAEGIEDRVLLETRMTADGHWFADTYIRSGETDMPLNDPGLIHIPGRWYTMALRYDGQTMSQFVDGRLELSAAVGFFPHPTGQTSIGCRINRIWWFKGAISLIRFTRGALPQGQLLRP